MEGQLNLLLDRIISGDDDLLAIDAFACLLKNDPSLSTIASKRIALKINLLSNINDKELMQVLNVLEECMLKCGTEFHNEVGKFRFLNELIRLVSPKHLGTIIPKEIRDKILDLLLIWTVQYPKETKIKEAYDMLIKQGVVHESIKHITVDKTHHHNKNVLAAKNNQTVDDYEMRLRKLLQSTNPLDVQAANLLIQNMVKETERSTEVKIRQKVELEKAQDNLNLLNDMLDQCVPDEISEDEITTIQDLYNTCGTLQITINSYTSEDAIKVSEAINEVRNKYENILKVKRNDYKNIKSTNNMTLDLVSSLLDDVMIKTDNKDEKINDNINNGAINLKELNDIFCTSSATCSSNVNAMQFLNTLKPLQPTLMNETNECAGKEAVARYFTENNLNDAMTKDYNAIDNLSEMLLQKNLNSNGRQTTFHKEPPKTTLNELIHNKSKSNMKKNCNPDIESLVSNLKSTLTTPLQPPPATVKEIESNEKICDDLSDNENILKGNNPIDNIPNERTKELNTTRVIDGKQDVTKSESVSLEMKPLTELIVDINSIKPGNEPPRIIMDEPEGLKIMLNFAKDHPREDVSVIVITTINQNTAPINNYQFDGSISKPCKLRLLPASGNSLPGVKPFRPPTETITQVLLISNTTKKPCNIVCIVSYCLDNDPDPFKESFEVKDLPYFT